MSLLDSVGMFLNLVIYFIEHQRTMLVNSCSNDNMFFMLSPISNLG